jgi:hypothetical protein
MKQIKYLYFCEDLAHRIFLDHFLKQLPTYLKREKEIKLAKPESYYSAGFMFKNYNHSQIKNTYLDVALKAIEDYRLDIFIVGLDLESISQSQFELLLAEMNESLPQGDNKVVIYLSVQCIEHWLWYLKARKNNLDSTKSLQLENELRSKAKEQVYGKSKVSNEKATPILNELLVNIDFDYLNQQSYSFRDFLGKIKEFLKTHNKSKS